MLIKTLPVGQLEENCYIVTNEKTLECVVIDPGDESNTILDYIESNHLTCRAIMITHGHYDHVGAADAVAEETGATVYMNSRDDKGGRSYHLPYRLPKGGISYDDGDLIDEAGLRFEIIATPGHTPGGVTIRCGNALSPATHSSAAAAAAWISTEATRARRCSRSSGSARFPAIMRSIRAIWTLPRSSASACSTTIAARL